MDLLGNMTKITNIKTTCTEIQFNVKKCFRIFLKK